MEFINGQDPRLNTELLPTLAAGIDPFHPNPQRQETALFAIDELLIKDTLPAARTQAPATPQLGTWTVCRTPAADPLTNYNPQDTFAYPRTDSLWAQAREAGASGLFGTTRPLTVAACNHNR